MIPRENQNMRTMALLMTALALAPMGALAQQGTDGAEVRVQAVMDAAAKAQIPLSLLQSKIDEGRAKGVSMDRIAVALEARLQGLEHARDVLGNGGVTSPSEGDLAVTADALESGVSEAALVQIEGSAPGGRRLVATAVLSALVQLGHVPEDALNRVQAALEQGPGALANLRAQTTGELRARGIRPPGTPGGPRGGGDF
jgi:hypothetical protein